MKKALWILAVVMLLACAIPCTAADLNYPTKPIHIWVGFAAGGTTDVLTRALGSIAEKTLGQPIIVENKPGGGGAVCLGLLASARPDGYTLGASSDSAFTRAPHMIPVKYDSMKDFAPIVQMGLTKQGAVVLANSPFKKFQDIIDYARKNPSQLTYSTPGSGTSAHLGMEKIALEEKVTFQHVPFQGDAPALRRPLADT
ncbi:MAG: tripartite tricarboxylate transporter substrate binding protein [Syntrophorhabdales bacterium]|jgi:tripartite-type tricarboxylate transporter receptor subunit TctC